jgi:hypothetical protein
MARTTVQTGQKTTTAARSAAGQATRTGRQTAADLAFLARALKAPALLDAAERLSRTRPGRVLDPPRIPRRLPAA